MTDPFSPTLDHLVFAVPDFASGIAFVEDRLGVATSPGGRHQGLGTRNRLVGLGRDRYLEIVSVDPSQPDPSRPRWFGLDELEEPRLVTWCVKSSGLRRIVSRGRDAGIDLGEPLPGARERPDGTLLEWTFTDPFAERGGGVVPFFIDWAGGEHPSDTLPGACSCEGIRVGHPDPERIRSWFGALGLDTPVSKAHAPRVVATLRTPNGLLELT